MISTVIEHFNSPAASPVGLFFYPCLSAFNALYKPAGLNFDIDHFVDYNRKNSLTSQPIAHAEKIHQRRCLNGTLTDPAPIRDSHEIDVKHETIHLRDSTRNLVPDDWNRPGPRVSNSHFVCGAPASSRLLMQKLREMSVFSIDASRLQIGTPP